MTRIFMRCLLALAFAVQAIAPVAPAHAAARKPLVVAGGQTKQLPAGDTVQTNASASGGASINLPHGSAPTTPTDGDCWTTTAGLYCRVNGSTVGPYGASQSGRLIGKQIITATGIGTYTPTAGTGSIILELQGAGGGGGAVGAGGGASNAALGAGGAGGGYLLKRLTADFSGASYTVGAKGTGGASGGNNNGNSGGATTFTTAAPSSVTYTAPAGGGGGVAGTQAVPMQSGRTGGSATTGGDVNIQGGAAVPGIATKNTAASGGIGGASHFGFGSGGGQVSTSNGSAAGVNGTGYGSGGGGGANTGTGATAAGGDGADGIIIIWEFS